MDQEHNQKYFELDQTDPNKSICFLLSQQTVLKVTELRSVAGHKWIFLPENYSDRKFLTSFALRVKKVVIHLSQF